MSRTTPIGELRARLAWCCLRSRSAHCGSSAGSSASGTSSGLADVLGTGNRNSNNAFEATLALHRRRARSWLPCGTERADRADQLLRFALSRVPAPGLVFTLVRGVFHPARMAAGYRGVVLGGVSHH